MLIYSSSVPAMTYIDQSFAVLDVYRTFDTGTHSVINVH